MRADYGLRLHVVMLREERPGGASLCTLRQLMHGHVARPLPTELAALPANGCTSTHDAFSLINISLDDGRHVPAWRT